MKQTYLSPAAFVEEMEPETVVCTSGVVSDPDTPGIGIDYGGVDEDGTMVPSARLNFDVWNME